MGRYDDISDARLRSEVARFARILQRMEEKGELLDRTADILTLLGELRRMVFAWEVRATFRHDPDLQTSPPTAPGSALEPTDESGRIVREAREAEERLRRRLDGGSPAGTSRDD